MTVFSLSDMDLSIISMMNNDPTISQTKLAEELKVNPNALKYRVTRLKERHCRPCMKMNLSIRSQTDTEVELQRKELNDKCISCLKNTLNGCIIVLR